MLKHLVCRLLPIIAVLMFGPVTAVESLHLEIGDVEWADGAARGVEITLLPGSAGQSAGVRMSVDALTLPDGLGEARALVIDCPVAEFTSERLRCERGRLSIDHPMLDARQAGIGFDWKFSGGGQAEIRGLALSGGQASLILRSFSSGWHARMTASGLRPEQLKGAVRDWLFRVSGLSSLAGRIDLELEAQGRWAGSTRFSLVLDANEVTLSDESGLLAGEGLAANLRLTAVERGAAWEADLNLSLSAGELYADPVYLDVTDGPLMVSGGIGFEPVAGRLRLRGLSIDQPGVLKATLDADLRRGDAGLAVGNANLKLHEGRLPGLYEVWLQPFLIGTALDEMDTEGRLSGEAALAGGRPSRLDMALDELYLHDRQGRFGLSGVGGLASWQADGTPGAVDLAFDGGHLARILIGASRLRAVTAGNRLQLAGPATIPVFDGRLEIDALELSGLTGDETTWRFGGRLTPIEMERLSAALGWPRLSGTLSGGIEEVRYEGGVIEVGGALALYVFDGTTIARKLRLEDPFGAAPVFTAEIDIRNLDLDLITRTFEFGRIQGRLDGRIHDLVLVGWEPARFDAALYTPEDDRSRRRISQKAVDNISRVGGGLTGALSTGFMRFFDEFSYGRLGLSCRLEGEVCLMDGIGPANGGYYIVKAAGLPPRIDVVGYTREVGWRELVTRIKDSVGRGTGPVIR